MIRSGYHDHFNASMALGSTIGQFDSYLARLAAGFEQIGRALTVAFEPITRLTETLGREQA